MSPLNGLVLAREGGRFRIATERGEVAAVLRGKARRDAYDRVVVGDRVTLDDGGERGIYGITGVEPRRNLLERRTPLGRGNRPVAANLDRVFVVTAVADPAPVPQLIDRLCAIAEANEIPVAIVLNKIDLDPGTALAERYLRAGYAVHRISAKSSLGLEPLFAELRGKESLLTGASGVGKSTLLNRLQPGLALRTREISERIRRGKNTTVAAVLVPLDGGGWLVDTPGFSEVGLWGIEPRELARCFPELREPLERCKFADCWHRAEPGCAVREAVARGSIHPERYASYLALLHELQDAPKEWE
ncbi:MAG TPA: ribosome small subunit-dependent GTPase A [Gemmatimonadales bacterium]|nr:ribosome small subunit-dependent GTPase A [Gemmatimonadales bacterium]